MLRTLNSCKIINQYYKPEQPNGTCNGVIIDNKLLNECAKCYLHDINNARKLCVECGKEFFPSNPNAKVCSRECKNARQLRLKNLRESQRSVPRKSLDELLAEIDEYNRTHGTHLTYGKYQEMRFRERSITNEQRPNFTN